jgi:hypothetical protein
MVKSLIIATFSWPRPKNRHRNTDRNGMDAVLNPWPLKCRSHREKVYRKKMAAMIRWSGTL